MEEILPPETEEGAGFERPTLRQFTVFLENKVGRLLQLVRCIEEAGGYIAALSVYNSVDTALVRLVFDQENLAREILLNNRFSFAEQELLAVEIPTQIENPLCTISSILLAAELNIYYAYPLLRRPRSKLPVLLLYIDDSTLAAQLLIRKNFTLIGPSDLTP